MKSLARVRSSQRDYRRGNVYVVEKRGFLQNMLMIFYIPRKMVIMIVNLQSTKLARAMSAKDCRPSGESE